MLERVLLTSGAGYIGSHTAKALYQNGYEVITIAHTWKWHLYRIG